MTEQTSQQFPARSSGAIQDQKLQGALAKVRTKFVLGRKVASEAIGEFDALRDQAVLAKDHLLEHLDLYLEQLEEKVTEAGGQVHWASTAEEAQKIILDICAAEKAKIITKGKSMISEEIGLNAALEARNHEVVETDLGEYIIQLRGETPSHIIAPAVHLAKDQVEEDFRRVHQHLDPARDLTEPESLLGEARTILREKFIKADVGITGANFLIAETGSSVLVTNEGNGDLTQTMADCHIVLASIDKVLPSLDDAALMLRLLARSATGQELTVYTTFATGTRRESDPDGPGRYHLVLLDNGRSNLLGTPFQEVLRCIRCGACMNHCPIYHAVGGHAYGWVYPGPIGSVMTPALTGIEKSHHLPAASTFCGRCEEVCPVRIPLPSLLRQWRERAFDHQVSGYRQRVILRLWGALAARPKLYRWAFAMVPGLMRRMAGRKSHFRRLPFLGGWTAHRDLAAPERGQTFQSAWAKSGGKVS